MTNMDEATLEAKLAGLLDDESYAAGWRGVDADDVRILGQKAQQYGVEIGQPAFKELFCHNVS